MQRSFYISKFFANLKSLQREMIWVTSFKRYAYSVVSKYNPRSK